jgi:hypothetical protein
VGVPAAAAWLVLALPLYAGGFVLVGEALRRPLARFSSLLAATRPIERVLIDLYLGGALGLALAYLPFGVFYPVTLPLLVAGAALAVGVELVYLPGRRDTVLARTRRFVRALTRPGPAVAWAAGAALFVGELALAASASAGNTFDGSVLTFFASRLELTHHLPTSFLPSAPVPIAYPPGTTIYLAGAQELLGMAPAPAAPLLTSLFLGLAPIAGYALGERLVGRGSAGAGVALVLVLLGTYPRLVLAGHYDFLLALPLYLLLLGWTADLWASRRGPGWGDALAFGALAGVSATLNPTGAIWLFLVALAIPWFVAPRIGRSVAWLARWAGGLALGIFFVLPQLLVALDPGGPRGGPRGAGPLGAGATAPALPAVLLGLLNPFQLGTGNLALSPIPEIELELALLLLLGALVLALGGNRSALGAGRRRFGAVVFAGALVAALVVILAQAGQGSVYRPLELVAGVTSVYESSLLFLTLLTLIAAEPLIELLERARSGYESLCRASPRERASPRAGSRPPHPLDGTDTVLVVGLALLILVPGAVTTAAVVPGYAATTYRAFGNLSSGDLAMLAWGRDHLPAGARVLVAPGGAGEFLVGYAPKITLLYPMFGGPFGNGSFRTLDRELQNGTLDAAGVRALDDLAVGFVVFTQPNSVLFPNAWEPGPFLGPAPPAGFVLAFHEQDAFVFARPTA